MKGVRIALGILGLSVAWATTARADVQHAVVRAGVEVGLGKVSLESPTSPSTAPALQLDLGLTVYGGDWYLRADVGGLLSSGLAGVGAPIQRPWTSDTVGPHVFSGAFGRLEVGPHWPTGPGALVLALVADGVTVGAHTPERDGEWAAGGRGLELGTALRYAWSPFEGLRVDPGVSVGAGLLWGQERSSGVWVQGELQALLHLTGRYWFYGSMSGSLRRYDGGGTFTGRLFSGRLGVALRL